MNEETRAFRFLWAHRAWERLSMEQRTGVLLFGVCGFATLVFSSWYIYAQIRAPFLVSRTRLDASRAYVDDKNKERQQEQTLRGKDTDRDGLNDWDELRVYKTSPYVADSDSDEVSDSVEIAQGQDPNCPKGRNCQPKLDGVSEARAASSSVSTLLEGVSASPSVGLTASQIRQFLITNRLATELELQGLSDQTVIQLYRRASTPNAVP